jgi:hypothetical protein
MAHHCSLSPQCCGIPNSTGAAKSRLRMIGRWRSLWRSKAYTTSSNLFETTSRNRANNRGGASSTSMVTLSLWLLTGAVEVRSRILRGTQETEAIQSQHGQNRVYNIYNASRLIQGCADVFNLDAGLDHVGTRFHWRISL